MAVFYVKYFPSRKIKLVLILRSIHYYRLVLNYFSVLEILLYFYFDIFIVFFCLV